MNRSKIFALFAAAAIAAGCGGNYSNEDIDFQLALPEREDLVVKLPAQSLETTDSAQAYRDTRKTVKDLNGIADAFLSLIDAVRAYPPTQRQPGQRIWGPFPNEKFPQWHVRMVMDRVEVAAQPARFEYRVEFRSSAAPLAAPWATIFSGHFSPRGGVRRGEGAFHFTAAAARAALYPLEGLVGIDRVDIEYRTHEFPVRLRIDVVNFPVLAKAAYQYLEEQDGSGSMLFTFPLPNGAPWVTLAEIGSRWKGSGAGRADLVVLAGLALGMKAVECWGTDLRPTYIHKDWARMEDLGAESTCVFGPP